ncbi:hypothetical protein [Nostoc sp. DedQUE07]|uniref:hypothetical protein n=1 Tax=Nostoc sp. DedQUE07 TaxID=3075392 RepID=UPI002AD24072|nr:hypothetical protein [Nostoc sp. DedQUE07]MDZ8131893.1 hypothetical protein [Nostoc sp. DedQUE07]
MEPTERFGVARCDGIVSLEDGSRWRPAYIQIPEDVILGDPVADARLIASAPEIYQALGLLVDLLETTDLHKTGRILSVAKERIAKAVELLNYIKGEGEPDAKPQEDIPGCHWFYGIENLTQDVDGYVRWKGQVVEHFSFRDDDVAFGDDKAEAAQRLAERCKHLESINAPICIANTVCKLEDIRFTT